MPSDKDRLRPADVAAGRARRAIGAGGGWRMRGLSESLANACAVAEVEGEAILVSPSDSAVAPSPASRGVSAPGESTVKVMAGVDRPAEPELVVLGVTADRASSGVLSEKNVGLRGVSGSGSTSRLPKPWMRVVVVALEPREFISKGGKDGRVGISSSSPLVIELGGETVKLETGELGSRIPCLPVLAISSNPALGP